MDKFTNTAQPTRIFSIDLLRGLVILAMVFANTGFSGSPWYMRHHPTDIFSGSTYVDYIYGFFLLLVGMAIPIAFTKYEDNWRGNLKLIQHVILRGGSLIFINMIISTRPDVKAMPELFSWAEAKYVISYWNILKYIGVMLFFNQLLIDDYRARWLSLILRIMGAGILIYYIAVFQPDAVYYEAFSEKLPFKYGYWLKGACAGVIGVIGWIYMVCSFIYMFVRKNITLIYLVLFLLFYISIAKLNGLFSAAPIVGSMMVFLTRRSMLCLIGAGLGWLLLNNQSSPKAMIGMLCRTTIIMLLFTLLSSSWLGIVNHTDLAELTHNSQYQFLFAVNRNSSTMGWIFGTTFFGSLLLLGCYLISDVLKYDNFLLRLLRNLGSISLTVFVFHFCVFNILRVTKFTAFRYSDSVPLLGGIVLAILITFLICGVALIGKHFKFTLKI